MDPPPGGSQQRRSQQPGVLRLNPTAAPFVPPSSSSSTGAAAGKKKSSARGGGAKKKKQDALPPSSAPSSEAPARDRPRVSKEERRKQALQAEVVGTELQKDLTRKLESGRYECIICMTTVGRKAIAWSCSSCYVVLHLACVEMWAKKSAVDGGAVLGAWRCPHCQHVEEQPPRHICYCGKMVRPDADPYLVVNSCGEVCEKSRVGTECPHTCNLVCHPGPCPPCLLQGRERSCHCGKRHYRLRCSEVEPGGSSCGASCGKPLACGTHVCERECHAGECGSCPHTELQTCYCGRNQADRPCGSGERDVTQSMADRLFSCGDKCGRLLDCGNHSCERPCHSGACAPCPSGLASITSCPCGRTKLESGARSSCLDAVPTCDAVCGRRMPCGHECSSPCHPSPCQCSQKQTVKCRCGAAKREVLCVNLGPGKPPVTCFQTCSALKNCGKHRCNIMCCPSYQDRSDAAGMHVCRLRCGKKLRCGNHSCEDACHNGRCEGCPHASFEEWHCPCGRTVVYPPISCGQKMPACSYPCRRPPRPCGHVDPTTHPCHPDSEPCPPCVALLQEVACACGAEMRHNVHCNVSHKVSCGKPCGAPLECGLHKCPEPCHRHPAQPNREAGCGLPCNRPLPGCNHPCVAPCHPGSSVCPVDQICQKRVNVTCPCGRQSVGVTCGVQGSVATIQHPVLVCDDVCAQEQRKKQLARAFGKQHQAWQDSQMLLGLARTHPILLRRIEDQLTFLVTSNSNFSFEDDNAIVPNVVFPSMSSTQRKLVHLVAESYGLHSESFGADASRAVWVTLRSGARPPAERLSDVLREQQGMVEASGFRASDCGVLLSQMSPSIKTNHLNQYLSDWKNQWALHWVDEHTCLIIFDDPGLARQAVNTLKGPFVATLFKETESYQDVQRGVPLTMQSPPAEEEMEASSTESLGKPVVPSPAPLTLEDLRAPPVSVSNTFEVLGMSGKKKKVEKKAAPAASSPVVVEEETDAKPDVVFEAAETWEDRVVGE